MKRNVLVLGGTRFFGKRLVHQLVDNGDAVTVASRNFAKADFGGGVKTVTIDRDDAASLRAAFEGPDYDLVYDQICYSPTAARHLCAILEGKRTKLVHTSTQSVYATDGCQLEKDFDPCRHPLRMGHRADFDYAEGKRLAEAVYFQKATFPITALRIPFVLGLDDYTGRLAFHVDRVKGGLPILSENPGARTSVIDADEAARCLFWLGHQSFTGPINACARGELSLTGMLKLIEEITGGKAVVTATGEEETASPYVRADERYMDQSKAQALGFAFSHVTDWLPALIKQVAEQGTCLTQ